MSRDPALPARWKHKHGAYYYRVPPGLESRWDGKTWFRLGKTLHEAFKTWAARIGALDTINTIGTLFDRYALEVVPAKAPQTQTDNYRAIARLRRIFGHMSLADLLPQHIYQYVDKRRREIRNADGTITVTNERAVTSAHREIEVLSHAYTKAVEWGAINRHPFKGEVRLAGEKPRERYVEDWEIAELLSLASRRKKGSVLMLQAYVCLKLSAGMARGDLLRLDPIRHCRDDGIHVQRHKTGKRTIYEWTDERRAAIDAAKAARPVDISPFLFCNKKGQGYINEKTGEANGFESMWQRFMIRLLKETKVSERFTEHDLRAKAGSDASSLERARALLQHMDSRTTNRVYRRRPERVS